jgi:hypothetical protein
MHPIDIVIPWVDGSDPKLSRRRNYFLGEDPTARNQGTDSDVFYPSRWDDCRELKICICSIAKFAPWVNKVFIITDGQKLPDYLPQDFVKEKVVLIDHHDTFVSFEDYLPTFNSASIATSSVNIKGLSSRYLLFNDDVFFCKAVAPEMFFDEAGKSVLRGKFSARQQYQRSLSWNMHMNNGARLVGFDESNMFRLAHCCQPIDKELVLNFREKNPEVFNINMSYKFRHNNQFTLTSLSAHLALKNDRAAVLDNQDWVHLPAGKIYNWNPQEIAKAFMLLKHENCYIGNINDLKTASSKVDIAIPFLEEMVCPD